MEIIQNIFYFLVAIGVLVAVHEAGHFFMARACGVYVERFSLGFGPVIFSIKGKNGTEYSLSLIPLGGYVKMYGEQVQAEGESFLEAKTKDVSKDSNLGKENIETADKVIDPSRIHESFAHKKVWQRFLIVAAGPLCNIVLAWLLYTATFLYGVQDFKPVFEVTKDSVAYQAGVRDSDLITSVNGVEVIDFEETIYQLLANIGDVVELKVAGELGKGPQRTVNLSLENWEMDPEKKEFLEQLGLAPKRYETKLVLAHVEDNSAAALAGLKIYDQLISVNGESIKSWKQLSSKIREARGETLELKILRGDRVKGEFLSSLPVEYLTKEDKAELKAFAQQTILPAQAVDIFLVPKVITRDGETRGYAGIAPFAIPLQDAFFTRQYDIIGATIAGLSKTYDMSLVTFKIIKKFISGDISPKNVSGPIGIAKGAGLTARLGIDVFIGFMALISVNLGVLNLLPVPVLDGGHLFFYVIEAIRGRPLSEKLMSGLMKLGLLLLLLLMGLAIFNDIYFNW